MGNPVIMVVDDSDIMLNLIKKILETKYEVRAFLSGSDAISHLIDNTVDLILLDYEMPGMTGYETLLSIRSSKNARNTPVIFLTGVTNKRLEDEMMDRGANDFIRKPIDASILTQHVQKFIHS